ncbi:MAG: alpha/beta fold hydrolase [Bacteroidia bacterium]
MQNIILLHGALGSRPDLKPLADKLKTGGCSVHTLEFSGHGKTPFEKVFNVPQFANELEKFILENRLQSPHVFGYSMGGYVALYLATTKPGLINKIITLGTKFNWTKEIAEKETSKLNPEVIKRKVPKFAADLESKHINGWEKLLVQTAELMNNIAANNYLNETVFNSIQNHSLIGIGDKDKMVTYEETATVFKSLPNAGMYMLPNTQHPLETTNIDLLSKIIVDFINLQES